MRRISLSVFASALPLIALTIVAQSPPGRNPDVSNKALITKSTPSINTNAFKNQTADAAAGALHKMADDYYAWRNENYPVRSSDAGLHTWDDRLTDYSPAKIAERAQHVRSLLDKARAMKTDNWPKDARIDWILFRSQLENVDFGNRVLKFERTNPQIYTGECTNAIFSLLKKEYDTPRKRALAATARLKQMPALLKQGLSNLQNPVKLYAHLAIQSARSIDPLLNNSLKALDVDLSPNEHEELVNARETEMINFLKEHHLVTLPDYLGPFQIRELPDAFKPTSPGGFMNPPGVYDKDPTGFFFIPTYNPESKNFYIRAAIEDPRPILGHEGIPGHFLQLSMANHLGDEIRRQHEDSVFVEGWALYGEEMLMRTGLYPDNSPAQGQILRLSRYRAARIGVDVNLHTGRWSFEQAVKYFMEAGGLDREAAEGEAAGAASSPSQKISYITGKWQIMRLLGRYRDRQGANFRLGAFHDELISYGTLPLSVIEWLMFDDESSVREAIK